MIASEDAERQSAFAPRSRLYRSDIEPSPYDHNSANIAAQPANISLLGYAFDSLRYES